MNSDLSLIFAIASIAVCPALCGLMAYRVSQIHAGLRNA
jgi:hypothetical protein